MVIPVLKHLSPRDRQDVVLCNKGFRKYGLMLSKDSIWLWSNDSFSDKENLLQLDYILSKEDSDCIKCLQFDRECRHDEKCCKVIDIDINLHVTLNVGDSQYKLSQSDSFALIMN